MWSVHPKNTKNYHVFLTVGVNLVHAMKFWQIFRDFEKFLSCLITLRDMSVVESPLSNPFLFLYFNSNYLIFLIKLTYHEWGHGWDILWRIRANLVRKICDDCNLSGSSAVWPSQCCKNKNKTSVNLNLNEIILDHENKIFQII